MTSTAMCRAVCLSFLAGLVLVLPGCGGPADAGPITARTIIVDGSSTVYPITREAARRHMRGDRGADVRVGFSGTTAGFRRFCVGELHIANASRPIAPEERAQCAANGIAFLEFPLALDTVAVVTHFGNDWAESLTVKELRTVWQPAAEGRITRWQQIRADWPDHPLHLFGRGTDSGTFDFFTERINGERYAIRSDYFASEDEEELARAIAEQPGSLGFFGIGAYHRHWESLRLMAIDEGDGPVHPSLETVAGGSYRRLQRQLYLYVNERALRESAALRRFLDDYFTRPETWFHLTGYLPLGRDVYAGHRVRLESLAAEPFSGG